MLKQAAMELPELKSNWDKLGEIDAMWAIVTNDPSKLGHGWQADEFFATGRVEIDGIFTTLDRLAPDLARGAALDFGCGVGRLSRALARRYARVVGVDIAPSMIRQAGELNADVPQCEWLVNDQSDLRVFAGDTFDLVYSNVVLQHMRPEYAYAYMREFVRVTKPGGMIVFQLPAVHARGLRTRLWEAAVGLAVRVAPRALVDAYRRRAYPKADDATLRRLPRQIMEMHGTPRARVEQILREAGTDVVAVEQTNDAGEHWRSYRYFARKRA